MTDPSRRIKKTVRPALVNGTGKIKVCLRCYLGVI